MMTAVSPHTLYAARACSVQIVAIFCADFHVLVFKTVPWNWRLQARAPVLTRERFPCVRTVTQTHASSTYPPTHTHTHACTHARTRARARVHHTTACTKHNGILIFSSDWRADGKAIIRAVVVLCWFVWFGLVCRVGDSGHARVRARAHARITTTHIHRPPFIHRVIHPASQPISQPASQPVRHPFILSNDVHVVVVIEEERTAPRRFSIDRSRPLL